MLRGRLRTTTHLYEDPDHPDRITGTVESPAWTDDDRCLLLALQLYESTLCPGCHEPRDHAWHSEMDGWYESEAFVCHACTARRGPEGDQVTYSTVRNNYPIDRPLVPFELGVTTTRPD